MQKLGKLEVQICGCTRQGPSYTLFSCLKKKKKKKKKYK